MVYLATLGSPGTRLLLSDKNFRRGWLRFLAILSRLDHTKQPCHVSKALRVIKGILTWIAFSTVGLDHVFEKVQN
jgi:hypothetical protein